MRVSNYNRIISFFLTCMFVVGAFGMPGMSALQNIGIGAQSAYAATGSTDCNFACEIGQKIGTVVLMLTGYVLYLAGNLFDWVFEELVLKMGELAGNTFEPAVEKGWETIRDLMNIAFIFGFVWIGLKTIVDPQSTSTRRLLSQLVIAALLINFSLFFTRIIIDVANVFAIEVHQLMVNNDARMDQGIGAAFMEQMGLVTIYQSGGGSGFDYETTFGSGSLMFYIGGAIFFLVASFVFAAGAFLLLIRFVALMFFMVFSPLLFASMVFPRSFGIAGKLWNYIISYAFFAPVYMLLLYISYLLTTSGSGSIANESSIKNALQGGDFSIAAKFFLIITAMIMSLVIASKMSVFGAQTAVNLGNDLRRRGQRFAGSTTIGGVAAFGRSTAGRWANYKANDEDLKDRAATSWTAKQKLKAANYVSGKSFDPRQIGVVNKKLGDEIGKGKKGGYAQRVKDKQKTEGAFVKQLGTVGDDDVRVAARKQNVTGIEKEIQDLKARRSVTTGVERQQLEKDIIGGEKRLQEARESVEMEKNRRVTGGTYNQSDFKKSESDLKTEKEELQIALRQYHSASTDTERQNTLKAAQEAGKRLKEKRKAYEKMLSDERRADEKGYISVIENRGWLASTSQGTNRGINRTVAENLRKEHEKKAKKSKEDKSTDAIVSAVKDSAKKDET